jgi:hypothetical protein
MVIWYIFAQFGMLNQEKSGNPDVAPKVFFSCSVLAKPKRAKTVSDEDEDI